MSWVDICSYHTRLGNFQIRGTSDYPLNQEVTGQTRFITCKSKGSHFLINLPVCFQKQVRWQFQELVVLHVQDLHLRSFEPIWEPP